MKVIKLINSILNFIVFTFFIVSLCFSGYALYDVYSVYEDTELEEDILKYKPTTQGENSFGNKFSVSDIKQINPDIIGWVRIDGTNIDYPILSGDDNSKYLKNDYRGEYSPSGSIFLDYRNDKSLKDDYYVIYGHNMSKGLMFSDIKNFREKEFFEKHATGKIYSETDVYDLTILSFNIIDANKSIGYKLQKYRFDHNFEILQEFLDSALEKRDVPLNEGDQLILLSTCYGVGTYDRSVLLGKIEKSSSSEFIQDKTNQIKEKKEEAFEKKVVALNQKKNFVDKIFVLVVYIFIAGILYVRLLIRNKRRKKKKFVLSKNNKKG